LPVGDYLLQISASGYSELRTHYLVENGKTTVGGAFLDPQTLPEEESRAILDPLLRTDYTLLHEYVVDAKTGDPISGVKVSFINAAMKYSNRFEWTFRALSTHTETGESGRRRNGYSDVRKARI